MSFTVGFLYARPTKMIMNMTIKDLICMATGEVFVVFKQAPFHSYKWGSILKHTSRRYVFSFTLQLLCPIRNSVSGTY
jgi:hypothetical protein